MCTGSVLASDIKNLMNQLSFGGTGKILNLTGCLCDIVHEVHKLPMVNGRGVANGKLGYQ